MATWQPQTAYLLLVTAHGVSGALVPTDCVAATRKLEPSVDVAIAAQMLAGSSLRLADRSMVGPLILSQVIGVQIPIRQPKRCRDGDIFSRHGRAIYGNGRASSCSYAWAILLVRGDRQQEVIWA